MTSNAYPMKWDMHWKSSLLLLCELCGLEKPSKDAGDIVKGQINKEED